MIRIQYSLKLSAKLKSIVDFYGADFHKDALDKRSIPFSYPEHHKYFKLSRHAKTTKGVKALGGSGSKNSCWVYLKDLLDGEKRLFTECQI